MKNFSTIFWDFDGVIKDSVKVKTEAYFHLFESFGNGFANKVRHHHECNGGMSRFEKIPIYLKWAGIDPDREVVKNYCDNFTKLVVQRVIDSPWVAGAENYIRMNKYKQIFFLVSATPQEELKYIVETLNLDECFTEIYGAPTSKKSAIQKTMQEFNLIPSGCLMIGDADADLNAANANQISFLLRRHESNTAILGSYNGPFVRDFISL